MARQLFQDPNSAQAVDLIRAQGESRAAALAKIADANARAAEIGGNANANAALQSGQAWSGAANQIGQTVGAIPGQIEQARMRSLQQQNLQGEIADRAEQQKQRARENASVAAGSAAIKGAVGEDGQIDYQKAADDWAKAGFPTAANAYLESIQKTRQTAQALTEGKQKIDAGNLQVKQAATNHLGELGLVGLESLKNKTPLEARDYTLGLIANAASHGLISEDDAHQVLMQTAQAGPEALAAIYQHYVDAAPAIKERALKDALTTSEIKKNNAAAEKQPVPKSLQSKSVLVDGKPSEVSYNPADGSYQMGGAPIEASRVKPIPPASMTINPALVPSGDALEMAAKRYLATGELPSMGMGQAGAAARVAVMNRAALIDPAASLAANKATFKADSANLQKLQTTEGTLSAFEKTAGKNLDQFLSLADKIPDTGVPWLNTPIRAVNTSGLGGSDQAAFNAARDVALREIARVTNDPKLSGSLTDSARAEVAGLSPANATFAQIKAVAKVLKQDMANVHAGINEQINTVKSGLQGHPGASDSSPIEWERGPDGKPRKKG